MSSHATHRCGLSRARSARHVYRSVTARMLGGMNNLDTAVAVLVFLIRRSLEGITFFEELKQRISEDRALIMAGVCNCPASHIGDIARSCGASGPHPFCQVWSNNPAVVGLEWATHPSYAMVFGLCAKLRFPSSADAPSLPEWLRNKSVFGAKALPF